MCSGAHIYAYMCVADVYYYDVYIQCLFNAIARNENEKEEDEEKCLYAYHSHIHFN